MEREGVSNLRFALDYIAWNGWVSMYSYSWMCRLIKLLVLVSRISYLSPSKADGNKNEQDDERTFILRILEVNLRYPPSFEKQNPSCSSDPTSSFSQSPKPWTHQIYFIPFLTVSNTYMHSELSCLGPPLHCGFQWMEIAHDTVEKWLEEIMKRWL